MSARSTMQAARWHGQGDVRIEVMPAPPAPSPGMTQVEVALCGICGTDVAEWSAGPLMIRTGPHPLTGQQPPVTLGHEFAGRVTQVGDGVEIELGTRVTADACWRCNRCTACVRGDYHLCRHGGSIGLHSDGALAALLNVPAYTLVALPDSVSDEQGALAEPLAVAYHGLERGGMKPASDVLVLGFGPIGACSALIARALGARPIVVDALDSRLGLADRMGFPVLDAGEDLHRRLRKTIGRLGADVVIEATGAAAVVPAAVACADRGGRIVLVGMARSAAAVNPSDLTLYERSLVGSLGYCRDIPRVIALMEQGLLDPTPLISQTIALDGVAAMLEQLATDPGDRVKVVVSP